MYQLQTSLKKDESISLIRLCAFCMIFTCHILQYWGQELAWWFNVGVQIFLCISGYLYGGKKINDPFIFIVRQFKKILLDYYIVIIPAIFLYSLFEPQMLNMRLIIGVLIAGATLPGGGHLWFIATILFCYLLTPVLSKMFDIFTYHDENRSLLPLIFFCLCICLILCLVYIPYFSPARISCFILGFALRRIKENRDKRFCYLMLFALMFIFNGIQIVHSYIVPLPLPQILLNYWELFCDYAHTFLGVTIFIGTHIFLHKFVFPEFSMRILDISDTYSYDLYLVHQFYILSPFNLVEFSPLLGLNVLIIITVTCITAYIVYKISCFFSNPNAISWGVLSSARSALMGFAMLWIMFFHMSLSFNNPVIQRIKGMGNIGVDIFLLLSGINVT